MLCIWILFVLETCSCLNVYSVFCLLFFKRAFYLMSFCILSLFFSYRISSYLFVLLFLFFYYSIFVSLLGPRLTLFRPILSPMQTHAKPGLTQRPQAQQRPTKQILTQLARHTQARQQRPFPLRRACSLGVSPMQGLFVELHSCEAWLQAAPRLRSRLVRPPHPTCMGSARNCSVRHNGQVLTCMSNPAGCFPHAQASNHNNAD